LEEIGEESNEVSGQIIAAAIEVHRVLGPGFLESVYEEALAVELTLRGLRFVRQCEISVAYKGRDIAVSRLDFLVGDKPTAVVVELKAVDAILPIHKAQVISYLRVTNLKLGLMINFNVTVLTQGINRIVQTSH
jgi:GxxExxY protein